MFYAGDEFCNTQFGNNNAYCQDNIISWLDWTRLEKYQEIHDFFRYMIAFRENIRFCAAPRKKRSVAYRRSVSTMVSRGMGVRIIPVN